MSIFIHMSQIWGQLDPWGMVGPPALVTARGGERWAKMGHLLSGKHQQICAAGKSAWPTAKDEKMTKRPIPSSLASGYLGWWWERGRTWTR